MSIMTLDPNIKKILEMLKPFESIDFDVMKIEDFRNLMNKNLIDTKIEEVESLKDFYFEHHGIKIPLRLYVPKNSGNGIIIYLHGGGFVFGNVELYDPLCRKIANVSGNKVLFVSYRLAPENKFPAALYDSFESYMWVRKNANYLGINPDKIVISGDSAGGNLTAGTTLKLKDENIPLPKIQIMFYPVLGADIYSESMREFGEGFFLNKKSMVFFSKSYISSPKDILNPYFSPILHNNLSGLPETIIITAEYDPLRDQSETFLSNLYDSGVSATGIRAKGMSHGFINFYGIVPSASNIISMVFSLVREKLKKN